MFNLKAKPITILSVVVLTLLVSTVSGAQDDSSSQTTQGSGAVPVAKSGAIGGALGSVGVSNSGDAATSSSAPPIQELGHGTWLSPSLSPLHWGSLYIGSAQFTQAYEDIRFTGFPDSIIRTSLFGTSVVYDTAIRGNHLALQWQPQIAIINGQFQNGLNNESLGAAYATAVTPRLTVTLQDHFGYLPLSNVYLGSIFSPTQTPNLQSVQNPFLQGPGSWLTNTASASVAYALTERATLTVTPSYVYVHSYDSNAAGFLGSKQYGGSASLNYELDERKTVGLFYSENVVTFDNVASTVPYISFGASLTDQVSPTWFINGSIGAAPSTYGTSRTIWSMSGYVDVQKRFERSTATLTYSRGLSLNQYSSQSLTDRADLNYSIQLTRKLSAGAGIGYQRVAGPPLFSGEYGSAIVGYQLLPSVGISLDYLYANQVGDNVQIYSEKQNSAFVSLSWVPPRLLR